MEMVFFVLLGGALALAGVAYWSKRYAFLGQEPAEYADQEPAFDVRRNLSGPILCEGVIYGPTGRVASRFVAEMDGHWDGNKGTLKEHFRYDSGRTQDREWHLQIGNDGAIRADADDLEGVGYGTQAGSSVRLNYRIKLPQESGGHVLDVTDWMYLVENGTIINRSQFRKFGIKVAELVATMRPLPAA